MLDVERCLKLAVLARDWGGEFHVLPSTSWPSGLSVAPFKAAVCALDWARCSVYVDRPSSWAHAVHEMAHCFAMDRPPEEAGPTEPVGWQFLLACGLDRDGGRDWISAFRTHGYNVGRDFRDMTLEEIAAYMAWTVGHDRDRGLLDGLRPKAVRLGPLGPRT